MIQLMQILQTFQRPAARWGMLFGLAIVVGALGGLSATGLHWAIEQGSHLVIDRYVQGVGSAAVMHFRWPSLLFPALGGLISGLVVQAIFKLPFGHGTNLYVRAFHRNLGDLPLKEPIVKGAAVAGVLSCGGSTGPEGPIAALTAALGSAIGRIFRLKARERRILLVAGCSAGVGAIFRCPLGGALFATSVLYREEEFEAEAIVPAFVASVIGYSTFIEFMGQQTYLLDRRHLAFGSAMELIPYAVLGPLCGIVSVFFSECLHVIEKRLRPLVRGVPAWLVPCIGGLGTGLIACALPQVMDGRYEFIENAMNGFAGSNHGDWWWVGLFGAVVVGKCVASALTVGSGASGGVIGPGVFIGGTVGAFLGATLNAVYPEILVSHPQLREALIPVGMGGVLAAGMRTPLAAIVMVSEMTGSYGLIVPLMLVCMSSYVVGRFRGLNTEQVRSSAESPVHAGAAIVHLLESWSVKEIMEPCWEETVGPEATVEDLVKRIRPGTRPVFAVAKNGVLEGIISVTDIHRMVELPGMAETVIAADIMTEDLVTVSPEENVYEALESFRASNHDVLPVVSVDGRHAWLGMLKREHVFDALRKSLANVQTAMFREHTGLAAIESEGQIQQLVMGVTPMRKDVIQRLLVPMDAIGKSIREADFRRSYGAQIIGVEQPDGTIQCPPPLDEPLRTGQRLLAIVHPAEVAPSEARTDG